MAAQICLLSALNKRARSLKEEEAHEKQYPHQRVVVVQLSSELESLLFLSPRDFKRE